MNKIQRFILWLFDLEEANYTKTCYKPELKRGHHSIKGGLIFGTCKHCGQEIVGNGFPVTYTHKSHRIADQELKDEDTAWRKKHGFPEREPAKIKTFKKKHVFKKSPDQ